MINSIEKCKRQAFAKAAAICFVLVVSVMSVAGQIRIGGVTIGGGKKPEVKQPANPNSTPANTPTSPNRPPATNTTNGNSGGRSTASSDTGPSLAIVNAFKEDAKAYSAGINTLSNMQYDMGKDWKPIYSVKEISLCLEHGAALAKMIQGKYPNIENPSWASSFEDKPGDWRRLAEDREKVVKAYLTDKVGALVREKAKELDKHRANMSTLLGYALPVDFNDREKAHAAIPQELAPMLALVGMTMPDSSVFAAYDTAIDALIAEERKQAGEWGWGATFHDPTIEAKARSWLTELDPQAKVISMGLTDATWEVNKNSIGIPEGRYRRGLVMYRKPGVDLCVVAKFSFEQSYIGGGRYDAMSNTSGFTYQVRLQTCK